MLMYKQNYYNDISLSLLCTTYVLYVLYNATFLQNVRLAKLWSNN